MEPSHTTRFATVAGLATLAQCAPSCLSAMIHFASPAYTVRESDGTATITVRCSPAPSGPVTVIQDDERPVALEANGNVFVGGGHWPPEGAGHFECLQAFGRWDPG